MANGPYEDKFVRASMMDARKAFDDAAKTLENTMSTAKSISAAMDNGALKGDAGENFTEAINNDLTKALQTLQAKMQEMSKDIQKAVDEMDKAVKTAKGRFTN
jgi:uncharacterized protein YukE